VGRSTRAIYGKRIDEYLGFVGLDGSAGFSSASVQRFVAKLHLEGRSHSTALSYVSAFQYHCKRHSISNELEMQQVKAVLKGFRNSPSSAPAPQRGSCSVEQLGRLISLAGVQLDGYGCSLVSCMFSLAFFGFLRVSEYSCTPAAHALRLTGCNLTKDHADLTIPSSKTSRSSVVVRLTAQPSLAKVCPVRNLAGYLRLRPACSSVQLFVRADRRPVSAAEVSGFLQQLAGTAGYVGLSTHSFRIGGATWAAQQGWSDATIRAHGRWQSSAFLRYVRPV
jgi:integrase